MGQELAWDGTGTVGAGKGGRDRNCKGGHGGGMGQEL